MVKPVDESHRKETRVFATSPRSRIARFLFSHSRLAWPRLFSTTITVSLGLLPSTVFMEQAIVFQRPLGTPSVEDRDAARAFQTFSADGLLLDMRAIVSPDLDAGVLLEVSLGDSQGPVRRTFEPDPRLPDGTSVGAIPPFKMAMISSSGWPFRWLDSVTTSPAKPATSSESGFSSRTLRAWPLVASAVANLTIAIVCLYVPRAVQSQVWRFLRRCRNCGYPLAGRLATRCPECGHS